jgi:hypothetical protein
MAKKLDPYRETARIALEPWLVQAALARLSQTLSPAEQNIMVKATRTPTRSGRQNGGANIRDAKVRVAARSNWSRRETNLLHRPRSGVLGRERSRI